jgi:predicted O-methyltransferase YrrM
LNKLFLLLHYFNYLFKARDEHSLHSPFAFEFYTKVIKDKTVFPEFSEIEQLRTELKRNHKAIAITDLGAGSAINKAKTRTVSSICTIAEKKPQLAQLIYRIVKKQQPKVILDLGTSLGITTLYEAKANPLAKVYTFEGCTNTAQVAKENFKKLSAENIEIIIGNIDDTLPKIIDKVSKVDFVFFDANHRYDPTMSYFLQCESKADEDSIFVFDDIYWSEGMKEAWEEIKMHPSVRMSIDLFFIGILFFRKKQPVQHFTLR